MVTDNLIRLRLPNQGGVPLLVNHPVTLAGGGKGRALAVQNTCFDTPELKLLHNGVTVTVESDGKGWRQRVADAKEKGVAIRLPGNALDPKKLAKGKASKLLGKVRPSGLIALFETEGQLMQWRLRFPEGVELLLVEEWGHQTFGKERTPYHELLLKLVSGTPVRLIQTALTLAYEGEAAVECCPHRQRAFQRLDPTRVGGITPWKPVVLSPRVRAEEAYTRIHSAIMAHLNANLCAARHGDAPARADGLREIHGAVTRLRTLVALYHSLIPAEVRAELDGELKWVLAELEPAFDWEDFVTDILDPFGTHFGHYPGTAILRQAAEEHRTRAYERMEAALSGFRFARLLLGVVNWIEGQGWRTLGDGSQRLQMASPARTWARESLDQHHRHVRKMAKQFTDLTADEQLRLREEGDLLLEAVDFFGGLFAAKEVASYRGAYIRVQQGLRVLGRLETAARLFQEAFPKEEDPTVHLIRGWLGARTEAAMNETMEAWTRFSGGLVFWQ